MEIKLGHVPLFVLRVADFDMPSARFARRSAQSKNTAPRGRNQSGMDAVLLQHLDHAIHRIPLADSARIEFHSRQGKSNGLSGFVQNQVPVAHLGKSACRSEE